MWATYAFGHQDDSLMFTSLNSASLSLPYYTPFNLLLLLQLRMLNKALSLLSRTT